MVESCSPTAIYCATISAFTQQSSLHNRFCWIETDVDLYFFVELKNAVNLHTILIYNPGILERSQGQLYTGNGSILQTDDRKKIYILQSHSNQKRLINRPRVGKEKIRVQSGKNVYELLADFIWL